MKVAAPVWWIAEARHVPAVPKGTMRNLFAVVCLWVLCAGCPLMEDAYKAAYVDRLVAPWNPGTFIVDESTISAKCIERLYDAQEWWEADERLGFDMFHIRVVASLDGYTRGLGDVLVTERSDMSHAGHGGSHWHNHRLWSGHLWLRDGDRCPPGLLAHEIGHVLGLPHRNEPGWVMTPGAGRGMEVSDAEMQRIRNRL